MNEKDTTQIKIIYANTPEAASMVENIKRSMAITSELNRLTFDDTDKIRHLFSKLIGKDVSENFLLLPPFYTADGLEINIGHNVFINQNCTIYGLGGLNIRDNVMIGPNVSIITAGHSLDPLQRHSVTIGKPIVIKNNVWICTGAIIIGCVTIGENSVIAAGSVVTKDVPDNTFAAGNPARIIRSIN
jgi:acetyltransferase-like isoleucine patch superfamily enzyme